MGKIFSGANFGALVQRVLPKHKKAAVFAALGGATLATAASTAGAELSREGRTGLGEATEQLKVWAGKVLGNPYSSTPDIHTSWSQVFGDMGTMVPSQAVGGAVGYAVTDALLKEQRLVAAAAGVVGLGATAALTTFLVGKGAPPEAAAQMIHASVQSTAGFFNGAITRGVQQIAQSRRQTK